MDENKNGSILGGPTREEILEALNNATSVTFTADNEEGKLTMFVEEFTDMNHPNVDRWKINGKNSEGMPLVVFYIFPLLRGLYLFN